MSLPKFETFIYFIIWISGVSVSLYHFYSFGRVFNREAVDKYHDEDFKKGWRILGERYQDQADYEWSSWTQLTWKLLPFLICNLIGAEFIRHRQKTCFLPLWYAAVSLTFTVYNFNYILSVWFVVLPVIYYTCLLFKSVILVWIATLLVLYFLRPEYWFIVNEDEQYIVMISSSWMILRCVSFCVEKCCEAKLKVTPQSHLSNIVVLLGYSLYLPTFFFGPFIIYSPFHDGITSKFKQWDLQRIWRNILRLSRCCFWYLFTELSLHYVYVNAILLRPHIVQQLFDWELAGLGIAMGHFFHLKYVVFYGIPCAWAAAEEFQTPDLPCCVSRIHLYSYMWRRFDHGLYQFLIKYIYVPITSVIKCSSPFKKTPASIACFAFVFAWHRGETHVFYWVLFNFIAVTIEALGKQLYHIPIVHTFCLNNFSERNILRMQCLLAAPLHYFSMVSNYFFIGNGMTIGLVYLNKFLNGSFKSNLTVLFFLYGAGQSAVATQRWEDGCCVRRKDSTKKSQ